MSTPSTPFFALTFPLTGEIDCKHFHVQDDSPAHQYEVICPECQTPGQLMHQGFYLSYPQPGESEERTYYCQECGSDKHIKMRVTLDVNVTVEIL